MGVCSKCDKSVEVEDGCVVGNLTYHRRCFACAGCKRAIKPSEYMIQDGENICFDCYNRNEIKTCTKCGDLIQGFSIKRKGEPFEFHSKCLECFLCSSPLGPMYEAGNVCFACYKLKLCPRWNNNAQGISEDL